MPNYANGKIYKLVNTVTESIYVGSTCKSLTHRKNQHKRSSEQFIQRRVYSHIRMVGWNAVSIVLIEAHPCRNRNELRLRERYWVDQLHPILNSWRPSVTPEERKQAVREYQRIYYAMPEQRAKQRARIRCPCGTVYTRTGKWNHERTEAHRMHVALNGNVSPVSDLSDTPSP
jgi:hypothetical protein